MDNSPSTSPQPEGPLDAARRAVYGDRAKQYGSPKENHTRTAQLWSCYLGHEVSARDVCMMNILQKISRDRYRSGQDNLVDIAGYAENAHLIEQDAGGCPNYFSAPADARAGRIKL